jgi:hypothetical protein
MNVKKMTVAAPWVGAMAATRGMLGFGAGLLMARKIPRSRRRRLGWTLLGVGAASTLPLAYIAFRRN